MENVTSMFCVLIVLLGFSYSVELRDHIDDLHDHIEDIHDNLEVDPFHLTLGLMKSTSNGLSIGDLDSLITRLYSRVRCRSREVNRGQCTDPLVSFRKTLDAESNMYKT